MNNPGITKAALGLKDLFVSEADKIRGCYYTVEMNFKDSTFSIIFSTDTKAAKKQYVLFTSLNESHEVKEALKLVKVLINELGLKPVDEYYRV